MAATNQDNGYWEQEGDYSVTCEEQGQSLPRLLVGLGCGYAVSAQSVVEQPVCARPQLGL